MFQLSWKYNWASKLSLPNSVCSLTLSLSGFPTKPQIAFPFLKSSRLSHSVAPDMASNRASSSIWIMSFNVQIKNNYQACCFCRQTESDRLFFPAECWGGLSGFGGFLCWFFGGGWVVFLVDWVFWCVWDGSCFPWRPHVWNNANSLIQISL